jgi:hypothetical protein
MWQSLQSGRSPPFATMVRAALQPVSESAGDMHVFRGDETEISSRETWSLFNQ